jgi:23S rRNA (adenine1618-N6)-methyltransferase
MNLPNPPSFHPRNRHQGHYDFEALKKTHPILSEFVAPNRYGNESLDFANPAAVRELNRALLQNYYGIQHWNLPENALCPPIPGRADMIHNIADLLNGARNVRGLDIGVGANCIYPIIGHYEYGWTFVGSDINPESLASADRIIKNNPTLTSAIELRQQHDPLQIFMGIIKPEDQFHFTVCNPPFHASPEEAVFSNSRKWSKISKSNGKKHEKQNVNFGGQGAELWCEGGEIRFLLDMILESARFKFQVKWFTTLVSRSEVLPELKAALKSVHAHEVRTLGMSQGQKKSRILAWNFQMENPS